MRTLTHERMCLCAMESDKTKVTSKHRKAAQRNDEGVTEYHADRVIA